jgi:hypothetical protein
MAASIGNFTIDALNKIEKVAQMPEFSDQEKLAKVGEVLKLCIFVKNKILFASTHCLDDVNDPEDEIVYGTAGYLQTLLLLKQELGKSHSVIVGNREAETKWADFTKRIDTIITNVSLKLMQQTSKTDENGE